MTTLSSTPLAAIAAPRAGEVRPRAPSGSEGAPPPDAAERQVDPATLRQAAAKANEELRQRASELAFEFDDDSGRIVVKLIDTRTREVLRQIPSKEMLEIARSLQQEMQSGALLRVDA